MKICYKNEIKTATITATDSTEFPKENLYSNQLAAHWSPGAKTGVIDFYNASGINIDYALLNGHNLTEGATITITADNTDIESPAYTGTLELCKIPLPLTDDEGNIITDEHGDPIIIMQWYKDVSLVNKVFVGGANAKYNYVRISISDPGNANNIEVGYIFLGEALTLPNIKSGDKIRAYKTNSDSQKNETGQLYGYKKTRLKRAEFALEGLTEEQRNEFDLFASVCDITEPFHLIFWENDLHIEEPLFCAMTEFPQPQEVPEGFLYNVTMSIEECK